MFEPLWMMVGRLLGFSVPVNYFNHKCKLQPNQANSSWFVLVLRIFSLSSRGARRVVAGELLPPHLERWLREN
jgi:hypothetical protein